MPAPIHVTRTHVDALAARYPAVAENLRANGWTYWTVLRSERASALAYETATGLIVHETDSRALVDRYRRERAAQRAAGD